MKAIVDWKTTKNGDPVTDVANFTMMFLQPEEVGPEFGHLAGHKLLLGNEHVFKDLTFSIGVTYMHVVYS